MKDDKSENSFYYDPDFYRQSSLCDDEHEIKTTFAKRLKNRDNSTKNRDNSSNDQGER